MAEGFIAVKDFETFQHYKGRTPPWIKLYNALLDDYRFLQLPDAARSQLMLIWLVASRHQNRIPNDPRYIAQAIHCTTKLWLPRLIQSGWLYIAADAPPQAERKQTASMDASKMQAKRSISAHLEVEGEKEREIETEKEKEEDAETAPAPSAIEAIADCFPNRLPAKAMLVGMTQGLGTPGMKAVPVEVLTEAMGELRTSGGEITPHRFKAFVRKVLDRQAQESEPSARNGAVRGKGSTTRALKLIGLIRNRRNPMHPNSVLPEWKDGLEESEAEVCRTFGLTRILNDQNEGTVVAQLARALEESFA